MILFESEVIQKVSARPLASGTLYSGTAYDDQAEWPVVWVQVEKLVDLLGKDPERSLDSKASIWNYPFHESTAKVKRSEKTPLPVPAVSLCSFPAYCFSGGASRPESEQKLATDTDVLWPHKNNLFALLNDASGEQLFQVRLFHALGVKKMAVRVAPAQKHLLESALSESSLNAMPGMGAVNQFRGPSRGSVVDLRKA